jgi:hypothetical protein
MSLSTETRRSQYTLAGAAQVLPVGFKFFLPADLKVTQTRDDVDTVLVLTTNYTVSGGGLPCAIGNVTMVAGVAGDIITIEGNLPAIQLTDLTIGGPFPANIVTSMEDYRTMLIQQILMALARTIRLPSTGDGIDPIPLEGRPDTVMGFDSNGDFYLYNLTDLLQYVEGAPPLSAVVVALENRAALIAQAVALFPLRSIRYVDGTEGMESWVLVESTQAHDPDAGWLRSTDYAALSTKTVWKRAL